MESKLELEQLQKMPDLAGREIWIYGGGIQLSSIERA